VKGRVAEEFGFNLHNERGKGHFVGAVDNAGIADRAGLETGQRIVGVNGNLIYPQSPHKVRFFIEKNFKFIFSIKIYSIFYILNFFYLNN
jgi:C-terminal processing protease CtpA/Prc